MTETIAAPTSTTPGSLRHMALEVFEVNHANGWFDDDRTIGDDLALLHSEVSEALEAYRRWGTDDATATRALDRAAVGLTGDALAKPEGVGSELADVLIRLLDTVHRRDVVPSWIDSSLGFVTYYDVPQGTFGDHMAALHKTIASGDLIGLLPQLLAVAWAWEIDLEFEYRRKIAFNRTRGYRHGGKRL